MRDGRAFLQIDAAHLAAARPGLMGDEHPAEHRARRRYRLVAPGADLHAACLAAPAGMDLRLDHPDRAAELVERGLDTLRLQHRNAARDRHPEPRQHLLGLIFVEVHGAVPPREDRGRALIALPRPPRLSQRRAAGRDCGGNPGQLPLLASPPPSLSRTAVAWAEKEMLSHYEPLNPAKSRKSRQIPPNPTKSHIIVVHRTRRPGRGRSAWSGPAPRASRLLFTNVPDGRRAPRSFSAASQSSGC